MLTYEVSSTAFIGIFTALSLFILNRTLRNRRPWLRNAFLILTFFILFGGLHALLRQPRLKAKILTTVDSTYPVKLRLAESMEGLGMGPAIAEGEVKRGLKLLDREALFRWNDLRVILCERSETFCAGLWSGNLSEEEIYDALALFTEAEMEAWVKISMASAEKIRSKGDVVVRIQDFHEGLKRISFGLSNMDQERLNLALVLGPRAKTSDAVFAMRTVLRNHTLPPPLREAFLRYLASL